jgi:RimJ/RimL family protein N-acetyltransferase
MRLIFSPMDEANARAVLAWRYAGVYAFYNPQDEQFDEDLRTLLEPDKYYFSARDEDGTLMGCYCYGPEAQVAGGDYSALALDFGCGVRPDLTGLGLGAEFIRAGMEFGRRAFDATAFRVTVAGFNRRALRACEKAGFQVAQRFRRPTDGSEFIVLTQTSETS